MIDDLVAAAGHYAGAGGGEESGPFTAVIDVRPMLGTLGVEIDYEAIGPDADRLHIERTVLTYDMMSGEPTLYVMCDELHGMGQLRQIDASRFNNGAGYDGFELQIEIEVADDGELTYAWSWGPPDSDLIEQSRAVVRRNS
jgi:hypothetical protein